MTNLLVPPFKLFLWELVGEGPDVRIHGEVHWLAYTAEDEMPEGSEDLEQTRFFVWSDGINQISEVTYLMGFCVVLREGEAPDDGHIQAAQDRYKKDEILFAQSFEES